MLIASFLSYSEDLSVLSEDANSFISPDDRIESPEGQSDWVPTSSTTPTNDGGDYFSSSNNSDLFSKGPPKSEVQLRYAFSIQQLRALRLLLVVLGHEIFFLHTGICYNS